MKAGICEHVLLHEALVYVCVITLLLFSGSLKLAAVEPLPEDTRLPETVNSPS